MIEEVLGGFPVFSQPAPELPVLPPEAPSVADVPAAPDAEQIQAVDAIFAQDPEPSAAAALLGLWSGAMIMSDLLHGHLHHPTEEVEPDEEDEPLPGEE
jgi:hypothetical protein